MDSKAWASSLVSDFRKRNKGGVWLRMKCSQVADELDERIASPERIHQSSTPFCGYATLAYTVLKQSPQQYAWCAIGLFEDGIGHFGTLGGTKARLKPPSDLRTRSLPRSSNAPFSTMPQVDWMVLASLRDHFNHALFDVGESIPILGPIIKAIHGGATASEIVEALKQLGCTECYDQTNVSTPKELGNLFAAHGHVGAGRLVFLRIDGKLLTEERSSSKGGRGSHWVGLTEPLDFSPDKKWVSCKVFSWGDIYEIPGGGMMPTSEFLKRYYGFVVGKF